MKFSFKKFVELVDQEADLTEEQLDEIFGAFATHDAKQKKIADQKKAEFDERRKALQAKRQVNPKAGTKDEIEDAKDPRNVPNIRPKNATGPWSANGQGKKAEADWAAQFEAVQDDQAYVDVDIPNHSDWRTENPDLKKVAAKYNLKVKKLAEIGPGGGNPLYRFTGLKKDLQKLLRANFSDEGAVIKTK